MDKATLNQAVAKTKQDTKEALQKVYDELAQGALVHKSIGTYGNINGGHVVLVYGVNSIGELLVADSAPTLNNVGIYENFKYSMPIHMLGSQECDCIIVKKP